MNAIHSAMTPCRQISLFTSKKVPRRGHKTQGLAASRTRVAVRGIDKNGTNLKGEILEPLEKGIRLEQMRWSESPGDIPTLCDVESASVLRRRKGYDENAEW